MTKRRTFLTTMAGGAMALIWRYAVADYISLAALKRPYPLTEAILTLALAGLISAITQRGGWRVISVAGLHGSGAALAILRTVYVYHSWSHPFTSYRWLIELAAASPGTVEWLNWVMLAGLTVWFWMGGWFLIRGRNRIQSHYIRLDLGLAFFLLLFLTKFLVWHKGGFEIADPLASPLLIAFMLFSLLTIGMARHQVSSRQQFISGHKTVGMMVSAIVVILLFSTGLLVLFLPYLTAMAEIGYTILKTVGAPIGTVMLAIVRFMFMPRRMRPDPPSASSGSEADLAGSTPESSWWVELVEKIVGYGAAAVAIAVLVAGATVGLWLLARWLWSRTPTTPQKKAGFGWRTAWLMLWSAMVRFIEDLWKFFGTLVNGPPRTCARFFSALTTWGRRSGVPRRVTETPLEYGMRLTRRFPHLGDEIGTIVALFNLEIYSARGFNHDARSAAAGAWRRLRSPRHWGRRLRSRLST